MFAVTHVKHKEIFSEKNVVKIAFQIIISRIMIYIISVNRTAELRRQLLVYKKVNIMLLD